MSLVALLLSKQLKASNITIHSIKKLYFCATPAILNPQSSNTRATGETKMNTVKNLKSWADDLENGDVDAQWKIDLVARIMRQAADELEIAQYKIIELWEIIEGENKCAREAQKHSSKRYELSAS